jgi:hypothetical protein
MRPAGLRISTLRGALSSIARAPSTAGTPGRAERAD